MNKHHARSRRAVLRGLGVALSLPWLESLAPRAVRAEATPSPRRFLPIFLPNGAHEFWRPLATGAGDAWRLSSVLEPFGALKAKLNVVSDLENASVFNADVSPFVEPSHSRLAGAWLTCVDAQRVRAQRGLGEANGVSIDQILANHESFAGRTALPSLQIGLSTALGDCDGEPCSSSRSVSWATATQPMYKRVDPLDVFNALVGVLHPSRDEGVSASEAQRRLARQKSVLDAVLESAKQAQQRLGKTDGERLDEFLTSVRAVEQRVTAVSTSVGGKACIAAAMPTLGRVDQSASAPTQTTATYDKARHADAMNDLVVMAFECDATRIITYMLEDERSAFTYDHVEERTFTPEGSSVKGGRCPEYHAAQHQGGDVFASITWWNVGKVAELCRKLDAVEEGPGVSLLDNCVVMLGGCMHGGNHQATDLPFALVGGQNLGLAADQHLALSSRPLRDLYVMLLNDVYGANVTELGHNVAGTPPRSIDGLLRA